MLSCHRDGKGAASSVFEVSLSWWRFLCASSSKAFVRVLAVSACLMSRALHVVRQKWLLHGGSFVPGVMAEFKEQESVLASALLAWEVTL